MYSLFCVGLQDKLRKSAGWELYNAAFEGNVDSVRALLENSSDADLYCKDKVINFMCLLVC